MNCKPGDLARIVDHPEARRCGMSDRIIRVTKPALLQSGIPGWFFDGQPMRCMCGCLGTIDRVADKLLRPIRDPGDDAKDEMLRPLPADAGIVQLRETIRAFRSMRDAGVCP